jgi:hypothetical protein
MKALVLVLGLLLSVQAYARGVIAQGVTEDDVTISLTDGKCNIDKTKIAYLTYRDGSAKFGCWAADESRVMILWDSGLLHSYSIKFFERGLKR